MASPGLPRSPTTGLADGRRRGPFTDPGGHSAILQPVVQRGATYRRGGAYRVRKATASDAVSTLETKNR